MQLHEAIANHVAGFALVALASWQFGRFFAKWKLPLISGYLFAGMIAGPFVLDLIPQLATERLRFIDELSLGFIAFAAGNQMYVKELRSRLRSIRWVTVGLVVSTFTLGTATLLVLSDLVPFMKEMPLASKFAVSMLAGAILVARSPSSALAVVSELRAKGPFTKTVLGVTVIMDVVVIVLYAVSSSVADALLLELGFDFGFVALLAAELALSLALGIALALALRAILGGEFDPVIKTALILGLGSIAFLLCSTIRETSRQQLPFEVFVEPLLICMIASSIVTNYSSYRSELSTIIDKASPTVFVVFFTLTGASLALDILAQVWPVALALFVMRIVGVFMGSTVGGLLVGDPPRFSRISWMAYITQAGIAVGLAKQVSVEFPPWGAQLATVIISVVVLNQIAGPVLFKLALRRVGESHLPPKGGSDSASAVILGIEGQSIALARQLMAHEWRVVMADTDAAHVDGMAGEDIEVRSIEGITAYAMARLVAHDTRALVAMLDDDEANCRACDFASRKFGIPRIVVRLNNMSRAGEFVELGAMVVNPGSAMVNLLDQSVRSPRSAALVLHQDSEYEMAQITLADPDIAGTPVRELRLPTDVLVLSVVRGGHAVVAHGYTALQLNDEVTLMGTPKSLEEVARLLG